MSNPDAATRLVGLTGITFTNVFNACATSASAIQQTADTIRLGKYDLGIAIGLDKHPRGAFADEPATLGLPRWYGENGQFVTTKFFGMKANHYLHKHNISQATLAKVAAWIDGRLDLAFNVKIRSDLRRMSLEAQSQMFAAPELVSPAYRELLRPLIEQLSRGRQAGLFRDIEPEIAALSIQGVVWSNVERQWGTSACDLNELREYVQRFCLRGLGVAPRTVLAVVSEPRSQQKALKRNASKLGTSD